MKTVIKGFRDKNVRFIYKLSAGVYFLIILSAIVNLIYNIATDKSSIFFTSLSILDVPYFKFLNSNNYAEILAFVIFLAVSVALSYMYAKELFYTIKRTPYFIIFQLLWFTVCMICGVIYFVDYPNPYTFDETACLVNFYFCLIVFIFMNIAGLIKVIDVEKFALNNPGQSKYIPIQNRQDRMHAENYNEIYIYIAVGLLLFTFGFAFSAMCYYVGFIVTKLFTVLYIFVALFHIVIYIVALYNYKYLLRTKSELTPPEHFLRKINIIQITSFVLFTIAFAALIILSI